MPDPGPAALRVVAAAAPAPIARPRLELSGYDARAALALERELGVSHTLGQILVRRGLTEAAAASEFLSAECEHPPTAFAGIELALTAIRERIDAGERIVVHGDYDVDGVCATAIMIRALRSLGANVGWFIPSRADDGYGLSLETVRRLANRGAAMILTVDCGITAADEIDTARQLGLTVVVTDHHAPRADGRLPDCPIVHPALCDYPCPALCGTGVAFKLAQALGAPTADDDLELVALATVADLVPLTGENRRLVRAGLAALATTSKPGLRALVAVSRADPSALDAGTLGFRLGPRINAAGRLARADAGLELLLCEDPARARAIANELDSLNAERRAIEQRIAWEAEAQVQELGDRSGYVLASADWHPGVIGIVASRIVERHHRPAVLIALDGETGTGSGRSIAGIDLLGALHACAAHLGRYGGHRAAAGLTLDPGALGDFRCAFESHIESVLTPELLDPVERVDAIVSGTELGLDLAEELRRLEPCGMGNPAPRLLVPGARFEDVRTMGEGRHARFTVRSGGVRAGAVSFGCGGRIVDNLDLAHDASFRLERNCFNGIVEPRLVLRCARATAPAPIDALDAGGRYMDQVLGELDALLDAPCGEPALSLAAEAGIAGGWRTVIDRRGHSPLATLADAQSAGGAVLALCADVERRLPGLRARTGGFTLASYARLAREPGLAARFDVIVALDPCGGADDARALRAAGIGCGILFLAWGEPELRFAQQMHELEYDLRSPLVALYRSLRERQRASGGELERLLRGDGPHGRPARLAGRLIRVLTELELVSLDRDLPALAIAGGAQTALELSPSYRVYAQRLKDGKRFLSSADHRAAG